MTKKEKQKNQIKQLQREHNDAQYQLSQCGIFQGGEKKERYKAGKDTCFKKICLFFYFFCFSGLSF